MSGISALTKRLFVLSAWLLCFCLLGSAHSHNECSRDLSRTVRGFVHERLLKVLDVPLDSLPESCPLHPSADLFWDQEQHKVKVTNSQWKCSYCSKLFKAEQYIDKHMQLKHPETINKDGQCLADLCPIFGCQAMFKDENADTMRAKFDNTISCVEDDAEAYRFRCESIAKKCFAPDSNIDDVFRNQICSAIRCERGLLQGPRIENGQIYASDPTWIGFWKVLVVIVIFATLGTAAYVWIQRSKPGQRSVLRTKGPSDSILDKAVEFVSTLIESRPSNKKRH